MTTVTVNPSYRLELTSSPHIHSKWSTKQAMWLVIIALLPAIISAVIFFGFYQLVIIGVCVASCVATEAGIKKLRKREITVTDGSAIITGILLGIILPPNFSLFGTILGSVVAVGVGKEIFGGLGYNIFNPALVGRAFLQAAFPVPMTTWSKTSFAVDGVSTATPLSSFKFDGIFANLNDMLLGNVGGSLGETSGIAILLGGLFLIVMRVVNWRVPTAMLIGAIIFGGIFWLIDPAVYPDPLFHIFAGGFLVGAFFMATDWVTSPITKSGMWIFGISISLVLIIIRLFGGLPEGVMYAILFMNAFVPLINRYTKPKVFGEAK